MNNNIVTHHRIVSLKFALKDNFLDGRVNLYLGKKRNDMFFEDSCILFLLYFSHNCFDV